DLKAADSGGYDEIGLNIAQHMSFHSGGKPTPRREPIYPLFLSIIYLIFGHSLLAVKIAQAILGSLTAIMVYFIGKRIFGRNCGILASLFCALYPHLITTTGFILTETLFTFLLSISILFIMKGVEKRKFLILAGIFLGLTTLTRSITILSPLFFLISFLFIKKRKEAILDFFLLSLFMGITIIPWTIRNYIRFHTFVPVATGVGLSFWPGTYLPWDGDWRYWDLKDLEKITSSCSSSIEVDRKLCKEAFKNIRENPLGYVKLWPKKLYRLWFWIPGGKEVLKPYPKIKVFLAIVQYLVIFLGLLGIIIGWERWKIFLPLFTIIIYISFLHSLFFLAIPRYNLPIMPHLLVFSTMAVIRILKLK
ncbi:MAG: glycosyltransferase family 39 protein, partial [bacterium]